MRGEPTVGLAVPAYRNVEGLDSCLRAVEAVSPGLLRNAVVVDDSGDGRLAAALGARHPGVRWIVHAENRGFGPSATEAVVTNPADLVVLLNDDVELLTDPVPHVTEAFSRGDLFAATFQSLDGRGRFREGAKRLKWPFGLPRILHNEQDQRPVAGGRHLSDYGGGGHAGFPRPRFTELGGFDPLFEPFYWEDVDLSVRARARSWITSYLPECRVRHAGESAIRSGNEKAAIDRVVMRNRLLFGLRHRPAAMRPIYAMAVAGRLLGSLVSGDVTFRRALKDARERWRERGDRPPEREPAD
jgi:GT2 family glycosyltransferase